MSLEQGVSGRCHPRVLNGCISGPSGMRAEMQGSGVQEQCSRSFGIGGICTVFCLIGNGRFRSPPRPASQAANQTAFAPDLPHLMIYTTSVNQNAI